MLIAVVVVGAAYICLLVWLLPKLRNKPSRRSTTPAKAHQVAKLYSPPEYPQAAQLYGPPQYPSTIGQGYYGTTQPAVRNTTVVGGNTTDLLSTVVAAELVSNTTAPTTPDVIVEQPDVVQQQSDGFAGFGGGETSGSGAGSNDWNLDAPCHSDSGSSTTFDSSPSCNSPSYDSSSSLNPPSYGS